MNILKRGFRLWWQEPRRAGDRIKHRQVTFLELFYDLVYVALVAELSHSLSNQIGWARLGKFAFLFVIVWWAWLNGSLYHDIIVIHTYIFVMSHEIGSDPHNPL